MFLSSKFLIHKHLFLHKNELYIEKPNCIFWFCNQNKKVTLRGDDLKNIDIIINSEFNQDKPYTAQMKHVCFTID